MIMRCLLFLFIILLQVKRLLLMLLEAIIWTISLVLVPIVYFDRVYGILVPVGREQLDVVKEIMDHRTVDELRANGIYTPLDYKATFVRFRVRWMDGDGEEYDTWECPTTLVKNEIYIKYCQQNKLRRRDGKPYKDDSRDLQIKCSICLESVQTVLACGSSLATIPCGHVFCDGCINTALRFDPQCPKCRRVTNVNDIRPLFM